MEDYSGIKIEFQGQEYWLMSKGGKDEEAALALIEHCDEEGNILNPLEGVNSFAHYFPEQGIMRYREKIGDFEDIKFITK